MDRRIKIYTSGGRMYYRIKDFKGRESRLCGIVKSLYTGLIKNS